MNNQSTSMHILSNDASHATRDRITMLQQEVLFEYSSHVFSSSKCRQLATQIRDLRRSFAEYVPEIVHFWDWSFDVASLIQLIVAPAKSRRFVSFRSAPAKNLSFLQKQLISYVARTGVSLVVGHQKAAERLQSCRVSGRKVSVIAHVNKPFAEAVEEDSATTWRLPSESTLIGGIAEDEPSEQLKDMIWAVDLLRYVDPSIHLVLFGKPRDAWRVDRFVRQVGIADHIHHVPVCHFSAWMDKLACFWLPNLSDVEQELTEAMMRGIPVIASKSAMNNDWIVPGETGIRFDPGDRAGLAKQTLSLLEHTEMAIKLARAAQQIVEKRIGVDKMLKDYSRVYNLPA